MSKDLVPSFSQLLDRPDELTAVIFITICGVYFLKVMIADVAVARKVEEVRRQREVLHHTYGSAVSEMLSRLSELSDSSARLAELNFQARQRDMQDFLKDIRTYPDILMGHYNEEAFLEPFRQFVWLWLKVYEQCSLDPLENPNTIISQVELHRCKTMLQVVDLLNARLGAHPVDFISANLQYITSLGESQDWRRRATTASRRTTRRSVWNTRSDCVCCCGCCSWISCSCDLDFGIHTKRTSGDPDPFPMDISLGCLKVRILSYSHARIFIAIWFGLALLALLGASAKLAFMAAVGVTEVLLLIILCYVEEIDERANLETQVEHLRKKSSEVEQRRAEINDTYSRMQRLVNLWRYRTVPRLDIMKELMELLRDTPPDQKLSLLEGSAERMERMEHGMGDLFIWVGESAIPEEHLALVAHQMDGCTNYIARCRSEKNAMAKIFGRLDHAVGFLLVRVVAAADLPNKDGPGDLSDPYAVLSVGKDSRKKHFRTRTVQNNLNPRWHRPTEGVKEEFLIPLEPEDTKVDLQVLDDNGPAAEPAHLGYIQITGFRELKPGLWHRRQERLLNIKTHKPRPHGDIEYEIYYATCVRHLDPAWNQSCQARASRAQRLSLFLSASS